MSKPRYNWWPFVLNMIRDYPQRCEDLKALRQQRITASNSGTTGGAGASRTTENTALRELPAQEMREYNAVHNAVERTKALPFGRERLKLVAWNLWRSNYTLQGAATMLHIEERTARRWRFRFILTVGKEYGFLTDDEFKTALKKDNKNEK